MHLPTSTPDVPHTYSSIASSIWVPSFQDVRVYVMGSGGDSQLQRWSSLIGIVTAICGNILISFALNIQRYAHIRIRRTRAQHKEKLRALGRALKNGYGATDTNGSNLPEDYDPEARENHRLGESFHTTDSYDSTSSDKMSSYLKSPYWWTGIVLMTVGEAGNFLAYGFAPASIVSPLGVVALISNCIIAPIMLKEKFRLRDFWGVVVAIGGAVTVVLSAKHEEKKLGPHEIWGAITTLEFEVYMLVTFILIVTLLWASPRYGNRTILIDLGLVGLFGGYTALSTKGIASMLSYTLWRALTTPVTYALIVVLVGTAVMQVRYVNKALQRFDSTQVIPVQFVMFTISVIVGSAVLYRDFERTTSDSITKFVSGCLLTFFGVFLITSGRPPSDDDEESDFSDEENEEAVHTNIQGSVDEERRRITGVGDTLSTPYGRSKSGTQALLDSAFEDEISSVSRRSSRIGSTGHSPLPSTPASSRQSATKLAQPFLEETTGQESTPLLSNPWITRAENDLADDPRAEGQNSMLPTIPPSDSHVLPIDPPGLTRPLLQGHTTSDPSPQPSSSAPYLERPVTPVKHSIGLIMPGPLLSPLSGGLSAVVADKLRRVVDSDGRKISRRSRLGLRRTKSGGQQLTQEHVGTNEENSPDLFTETPGHQSSHPARSRATSLSNTLNDFFRSLTQRNERADDVEAEEAGPSRPRSTV
ncbi:magnesium transporter NIPA-domain-containing protein, partial [Xylogone sp. PMI_703]